MKPNSKHLTFAWTIGIVLQAGLLDSFALAQSPTNDEVPSWQIGVSTFSGMLDDVPANYSPPSYTAPITDSQITGNQGNQWPATTAPPSYQLPSLGSISPTGNSTSAGVPYTVPTEPGAFTNPYAMSTESSGVNAGRSQPSYAVAAALDDAEITGSDPLALDDAIGSPDTPKRSGADGQTGQANDNAMALPPPVQSDGATDGGQAIPKPEDNTPSSSQVVESIESNFNSSFASEQPPLQREVIRWYQYPSRWMRGWDSHAEFGLDGGEGNADTLAIQTGLETKRVTDAYTLALDFDYRQASSRGVTTEENGRLNIDYDRLLADSDWSAFGKFGLEWDQFKSFDLRLNLNSGVGYHWVRSDDATLVTRFGAGASRELGAPVDEWTPEAVFGIDAEKQLNDRHKLKAKLDYFPAWEDFGDYRIVADVSWEILLSDDENFSLKLAATDRYDSTPQGAEPNDLYYSLLLLYKF